MKTKANAPGNHMPVYAALFMLLLLFIFQPIYSFQRTVWHTLSAHQTLCHSNALPISASHALPAHPTSYQHIKLAVSTPCSLPAYQRTSVRLGTPCQHTVLSVSIPVHHTLTRYSLPAHRIACQHIVFCD